jgi:hypothetical protein
MDLKTAVPMCAEENELKMEETASLEPTKKPTSGRNAPGGPPGNQYAKMHGVRGLQKARRVGKIDKRTAFGQAFERRKRDYIAHLGGDLSAMELAIVEDTVWTDFYTIAYDVYLSGLKSVIRKGRPHPIVDARTKLAAHRRENL